MYEVVGYRYVDMITENGRMVGYSCHIVNHTPKDGLEGCEVFKQFFRESQFPDFRPTLGMSMELFYDEKKKLSAYLMDGTFVQAAV